MNLIKNLISKLANLIFQILDIINLFKKDKEIKQFNEEEKKASEETKIIENDVKQKKINDLNKQIGWDI